MIGGLAGVPELIGDFRKWQLSERTGLRPFWVGSDSGGRGAESFEPNDTESVWTVSEHRYVYVELQPEHAGHAMVTLFVDDFDGFTEAAAQRGIYPETRETYDNGVRKATYRDPDRNEIGVGGAPVDVS